MTVDLDDLFDGAGLEEGRGYALFNTEDYAIASRNLFLLLAIYFERVA